MKKHRWESTCPNEKIPDGTGWGRIAAVVWVTYHTGYSLTGTITVHASPNTVGHLLKV